MSSTIEIKRQNLDSIRTAIQEQGVTTKAMLSQLTGLSVATCNNLLNEMFNAGELLSVDQEASQGGRKALRYTYNKDYFHVLTLQIKSVEQLGYVRYSVADALGQCVEEETLHPQNIDSGYLIDYLSLILRKEPLIRAVAVAVPGIVVNGEITQCDIAALEGVKLQALLEESLGVPVIVENDMNFIAYGVYCDLGLEEQSLIVIDFPMNDPAGSGIVIDGKIYKGAHMFAGELAYALSEGGIPRETQHASGMERGDLVQMVVKAVVMASCVLDPGKIVLMCERLDEQTLEEVRTACKKYITYGPVPSLSLRRDYYDCCSMGMNCAVLNSMRYNFQLIV